MGCDLPRPLSETAEAYASDENRLEVPDDGRFSAQDDLGNIVSMSADERRLDPSVWGRASTTSCTPAR